MALNLVDFSKEVYQNAVAHGWHETERNPAEIYTLIHSELSEALEEYRCSRGNVWYGEGGKPEGIAIELLDAVIRIFDFLGKLGVTFQTDTIEKMADTVKMNKEGDRLHNDPFPVYLCEVHDCISKAYEDGLNFHDGIGHLLGAVALIFKWLQEEDFDIEKHLIEKHEFNKSRPFRHGNKVC